MLLVSTKDDRLKMEKIGEGVYAIIDARKASDSYPPFTDVTAAYNKLCKVAQQEGYQVSQDFIFHVKK